MFEDSTFESTGRIKTRSPRWMIATFALNGGIVLTLVMIPLIYPDALPSHMLPSLLVAPEAPKPLVPRQPAAMQSARGQDLSVPDELRINARPMILIGSGKSNSMDRPSDIAFDGGMGGSDGNSNNPFGRGEAVTVVHPAPPASVHLPSKLVEGFVIYKNVPPYPVIAKTARVEGTVILEATISKGGTIENLRVVSGSLLLRQAAIDAVKTWRYRPYLLNQQPVEVETTVSVIFKLEP